MVLLKLFETQFQPKCLLNHTVVHKHLINKELYLTLSKYVDKLLVVKSLINILKFSLKY